MEEVNPSATAHSGNSVTSSGRRARGPTRMPSGMYTITAVDEDGNPTSPKSALTPYSNAIGVIARDDIPIKYRHWKKADVDELEWTVPNRYKDLAWERLKRTFQFPEGSEQRAKDRALQRMSVSFKKWKSDLASKFIRKGLTPNFEDNNYRRIRLFWDDFVAYRASEEAKEISERNQANSAKNLYPHRLGPSGYAKNVDKWREREDELLEKGIEIETKDWSQRAKNYQYARGATLSDIGELVHKGPREQEVTQRLHDAHQKSSEGSFVPNREKDELTLALQNDEHPGRTRGVGLVPWREGFTEDGHRYRSRRYKNSGDQSEEIRQLKDQMALIMARLDSQDRGDAGRVISPGGRKSSCASTKVPQEPDMARYPVDDITVRTACRLHVPLQNITQEVARGMAHPVMEGGKIHSNLIPSGYSRVEVGDVPSRYRAVQLDFAPEKGINTLGEAVHNIILWRKRFIVFPSGDSDDEPSDDGSSSEGLSVSPRRMPTPPPLPRKSQSPPPAQRKSPSPPPAEHHRLASSDPPKKRGRLCKTSQMFEPPSLKKTKKAPLPNMSEPTLKEKKKEAANVKVPVAIQDHFIRMARPPAPLVPISNFRRTIRKKKLQEFSKEEFETSKTMQDFLEGARLNSLFDVRNIANAPLAAQYKLGHSLTTDEYRNIVGNCTQMRRVEEWYLQMAKEGKEMFPVFYRDEDFHHCDGIFWVPFKELFQLYNLMELDLSLIQLWTLMAALECRTTHGKLGFLDPQIINSRNIDQLGDKSEQAVVDYVPHWILLVIHLNDSKIVVFDGLRTPQAKFQSVIDTLNKALVRYKKKCIRHAPRANTFRVWAHPYCLRQDPGTSTCGFYLMRFMSIFMEDNNWNIMDAKKLKLPTSKLLPHACFGLAEQLCGFIFNHIISSDGAYNISKAPTGLVGFIEAGCPSDTLDSRSTTKEM
ncbi:uncharacterized protein [Oryza sativa Japonica Group]|uniref:uncharacterized protein n=1 Tax=Oryza sativa subsp. japonica TaxID=39947 RepID=UPI0001C7B117